MGLMGDFFSTKKTVLVIEDDNEAAEVLGFFLRKRGYNPVRAEDGVKGVQMARKIAPDLVWLDIMLPKLDGFEVLSAIKSLPKTKDIPVLVCSALNGMKDVEKCYGLGAEGYITKPYEFSRITRKINSILARKDHFA